MTRFFQPSEDSVRGYYKSIGLDAVNFRRKNLGLKEITRLGGFSCTELIHYHIIHDEHTGWVNDGKDWFYLDKGRVLM